MTIETLERALAPLFTIGSFCNLGIFEHPLGQPRPYFSCLYALVKWSFLTYFFSYPLYIHHFQKNETHFEDFVQILGINTLIVISLYRFKELKMCLRELAIIDDTLEALGMPKEYQRLRNWIFRIIIGWIVYFSFRIVYFNLSESFFRDNSYIHSASYFAVAYYVFMILFVHYSIFVIILSNLISAIILGYTSSRFHRVNDLLRTLYSDLFGNNADYRRQNRSILVHQRITGSKDHNQYIWIIMHVHLQLCLISRKLNIVFRVQMLMQMIMHFSEACLFCLLMYQLLGEHQQIWTFIEIFDHLYDYFILVLDTMLFLTLNYICQTVYYKINETVAILYKMSNYDLDEDLREQILQFILQIKQTKVKFGMGHYYFGYNFICKMYSLVLSATIILTTEVYNRPSILAVMHEKFCLIMV